MSFLLSVTSVESGCGKGSLTVAALESCQFFAIKSPGKESVFRPFWPGVFAMGTISLHRASGRSKTLATTANWVVKTNIQVSQFS